MIPLNDTTQVGSVAMVNWLLFELSVALLSVELSLGPYAETFIAALGVVPARLLAKPTVVQVF